MKMALKQNADTSHETAAEWYASYGAHVCTQHHGDITPDVVDYDSLDDDDDEIAEALMDIYSDLTRSEADEIIALARRVKDAADAVVSHLEDAVKAYKADDLAAVVDALDCASSEESEHGDDPSAKALREALVEPASYTVSYEYRACGNWLGTGDPAEFFDDEDAAIAAADAMDSGDYSEGEYRATVHCEQTEEKIHVNEWEKDPAAEVADATTWLVEEEGEFTTEKWGVSADGKYVHQDENGGSRGAHSRQEGDGRWSQMADAVDEITLDELARAIIESEGGDIINALVAIAKAPAASAMADLILELEWDWTDDDDRQAALDWTDEKDPVYDTEIRAHVSTPDQIIAAIKESIENEDEDAAEKWVKASQSKSMRAEDVLREVMPETMHSVMVALQKK